MAQARNLQSAVGDVKSQQYDPMGRPPQTVDQVSKVLVLSEKNTTLREGTTQQIIISGTAQ